MASNITLKQVKFNYIDNIICFIINFLILWDPINIFVLKIDGAGRIPNTLSVIGLFLIFKRIRQIFSSSNIVVLYIILSIYMFLNAAYKGCVIHFYDSYGTMFFTIFRQQILMWMIIYLCNKNLIKTTYIISIAYFLFVALCTFFVSSTSSGRLGEELDSNNIGIQSCFAVGFMILYQILNYNQIKIMYLICWLAIPIVTIIQTGSRTAFIILSILLFGFFLFCGSKKSISQLLRYAFFLFILFIGAKYVMDNTTLGERLAEASTQMEGYTDTIFDKFGDRGPQYFFAWPIILSNFFTGIGLRNYISVGETGLVLHSEILVQFCENGIIGLLIFLLIYCALYKTIINNRRILIQNKLSLQTNTFVLIFLIVSFITAFVMWSYSFTYSFSLFGIIIGINNRIKNGEIV